MTVENSVEVRDSQGNEVVEGSEIKPGFVYFEIDTKPGSKVEVLVNGDVKVSHVGGGATLGLPFKTGRYITVIKFQHQDEEKKLTFTVA
ncbi:hypothetical protein HNR03_001442 [Pseudomonas sp. JAI111]|uniref:hypothetical protein n=1 Tax=Pseudomonas sp. JAI111 TaxID=2735913 RepID=UPI002166CCE8|nr:hypothetical protein [Pseudomonas sp. JAI111]MCS3836862.1 hypothetical protein [Pseudomonas sp. JAI111]